MERKWWVLVATGIGTYMSALDGSIVNTVLPILRRELKTDVAGVEWVVTVYLLVVSGVLLGFGRLGDLRGHRPVYLSGFVLFVGASALCGLATGVPHLAAARGAQAIGAAMLFSNSPAILTASFPPEQRGRALGLQAMMTYLGLTTGPPLGGWLTAALSWRAIFYVNVPIGMAALLLGLRVIPKDAGGRRGEPFDHRGATLFTVGLVALLLALNRGHVWGWVAPATVALLAGALATLVAFVVIEAHTKSPMLDLSLFRSRTFAGATASAMLNYVALFHLTFVLPFYLIQGRGFDPARTGTMMMLQPIVMSVAAPVSGTLSDRTGTRAPCIVGMAVLASALWCLSYVGADSPTWQVGGGLALAGLGTGMFIAPNNSALLGAAPRERQGIASGILAEARNVGMVLGIGLAGAIVTTILHRRSSDTSAIYAAAAASLRAGSIVAIAGAITSALRGYAAPRTARAMP